MSNHQRFAQTATRLIAKHGRDVGLVSMRSVGQPWDPLQDKSSTTVKAVNTRFSKDYSFNSLVESGDRLYLVGPGVKPTIEMRLKDGDDELSIIAIEEVKPGEQSILYRIHAR